MIDHNISWNYISSGIRESDGTINYLAELIVDGNVEFREYLLGKHSLPDDYWRDKQHHYPGKSLSIAMMYLNMAVVTTPSAGLKHRKAAGYVLPKFNGDYREAVHDSSANTLSYDGKTVTIPTAITKTSDIKAFAMKIAAIKLMRPSMVMLLTSSCVGKYTPVWGELSSENPL